jgi:prepilin-type N-terminal cleavage/methylation domain-containing protein
MRRAIAGFTLLEVLMAILVVSVGLLGFIGTLRRVASLAAEGRARGRAAIQLTSRVSRLRSEVLGGAPGCVVPVAGSALSGSGISESWTATLANRLVDVQITASIPRARGVIADTLVTRIPCP